MPFLTNPTNVIYLIHTMSKSTYKIHLESEPEGGFTVTVPALPGCVTWGEDFDHAQQMARECSECPLEALAKSGQPIPQETALISLDLAIQVQSPAQV